MGLQLTHKLIHQAVTPQYQVDTRRKQRIIIQVGKQTAPQIAQVIQQIKKLVQKL